MAQAPTDSLSLRRRVFAATERRRVWVIGHRGAMGSIKNAPIYYAGIEEAVVESLDRAGMAEQVIVISFDHRSVQRTKALDSRIVTGVLYAARPTDGGVGLMNAGVDANGTNHPEILRELISARPNARDGDREKDVSATVASVDGGDSDRAAEGAQVGSAGPGVRR